MTLPETFDYFNDPANDRNWWLVPQDSPDSVALLTAAVRLSGRMEECCTAEDLREAVHHTMTLVSAGIMTTQQWAAEAAVVEMEMDAWADALSARLQAIAESN